MVTKTVDEMTDAELEAYLAERKRTRTLDKPQNSDIMTSERGKEDDTTATQPLYSESDLKSGARR